MDHNQDRLVSYYMNETNKRLDRIESRLEVLIEHRAMLLGRARVMSLTIATITSLIVGGIEWFFKK